MIPKIPNVSNIETCISMLMQASPHKINYESYIFWLLKAHHESGDYRASWNFNQTEPVAGAPDDWWGCKDYFMGLSHHNFWIYYCKQLLWWRIAGSRTKKIHAWSLYKMDPKSLWPGLRSLCSYRPASFLLSFHLLGRLPGDLAQSRSSIIDESILQLLICFCYTWHQKTHVFEKTCSLQWLIVHRTLEVKFVGVWNWHLTKKSKQMKPFS